ncbi:MAG TPA: AI-2E family transporter, partial [Gemmatimonadaceae bacterium]|nr:AI-2E family transporter [Gemmatimonadaceae bacterium]
VVLTGLLLWLFFSSAHIFLLLFLAILISLYLGALTDILHRRTRLARRPALAVAVLATLAAIAGLFWLLVPPVVEQTQALVKVLPDYILKWESGIERFVERVPALSAVWRPGEHKVLVAVYEQIAGYFNDLLPKLASVLHGAINVFSVAIMGLYLALHPGMYREFLIALFPPLHRDLVRNVLGDLTRTLRAWIVGQMIAMVLLGALTALGLWLLGVPYWLTFGVFTGAAAIVPFFGSLVSTLLPALFVLGGSGGVTHALLVVGLGVVVHIFEGNVVAPLIMSKQVDLPPVLTIMAVLLLGKLLGPMGLLVAVPTVAIIMVVVRRILINRIYEGQGFRRTSRDSVFLMRVPPPDKGVLLSPSSVDIVSIAAGAPPRRRA